MSKLTGRVQKGEASRLPVGIAQLSRPTRQSGAVSPLIERLLPGMIARGHGIETLCLYLAIAQVTLFDAIIALGLTPPHDQPHRKAGGRNPWRPEDVSVFIALWMEGWAAASLAERFSRSRSGIWSKARQLGLPRRERSIQFRPSTPHAAVQLSLLDALVVPRGVDRVTQPISIAASVVPASQSSSESLPSRSIRDVRPVSGDGRAVAVAQQPAAATLPPATKVPLLDILGVSQAQLTACLDLPAIARKGGRGEIAHDAARDLQLALRVFSSQHYLIAAREMGMSVSAFTSRRRRLGIPPMARGESVEEFNPEWAATMIEALELKRVQCRGYQARGVTFFFWCKKRDHWHYSQLAKGKTWYKETFAGIHSFH